MLVLHATLRKYIEASGGELQLVARFPDDHVITLAGVFESEEIEENSSTPLVLEIK